MKVQVNWNQRFMALGLITGAAIILGGFMYVSEGRASNHIADFDDFSVGDQVEASVSGLEVESAYEPCLITEVLGNGYRLKCTGIEYVVQKAWVRQPRKDIKPPPEKAPEPPVTDDEEAAAPDADCDLAPPGPKTEGTDRFSTVVAKREIYDNYKLGVRAGGVTSPLNIGVTFLTLELGRSFKNVAPDGYRINDAAPANATIYHVKSKHIVCEQYRDRTLRRQVESGYSCFKNRDGEWACGVDGFPKIIQLN